MRQGHIADTANHTKKKDQEHIDQSVSSGSAFRLEDSQG